MKKIQLAAFAEDRKKLLEEQLQTSQGKFLVPKMLDTWMHNLCNFPEFSSVFTCNLAKPGLSFFHVIIYLKFNRSFFLSES